jgi:hypothetical protein
MSTFEYIQLMWNSVMTLGVGYLFYSNASYRREIEALKSEAKVENDESLSIQMKQIEVDGRKNHELALQAVEQVMERVRSLQRIVEENLESLSSPSVEAIELRTLAKTKDEIPTVRQIERTKVRLNQELHVDLRTLLREQLA